MSFEFSLVQPPVTDDHGLLFVFDKDKLLVEVSGAGARIPFVHELRGMLGETLLKLMAFGVLDGVVCYTVMFSDGLDVQVPARLNWNPVRTMHVSIGEELFGVTFRALHLARWLGTTRFCNRCGAVVNVDIKEPAQVCTMCNHLHYPKISPAVIVAVVKGDRILLGHSGHFPGKLYSVIAGFVEPGETLEACVIREVKEETGIAVDEVTYFGSQPWPFPDSLMIAFTARYAGGEITVDGEELLDAGWFTADNLPDVPQGVSISRRLIDWFIQRATVSEV